MRTIINDEEWALVMLLHIGGASSNLEIEEHSRREFETDFDSVRPLVNLEGQDMVSRKFLKNPPDHAISGKLVWEFTPEGKKEAEKLAQKLRRAGGEGR